MAIDEEKLKDAAKKHIEELMRRADAPMNKDGRLEAAQVPLKQYFERHLPTLFIQAGSLFSQKQMTDAYVLYFRYCSLAVTLQQKHPEYKKAEFAAYKDQVRKNLASAMTRVEKLQTEIKEAFIATHRAQLEKEIEAKRAAEEKRRAEELKKQQQEEARHAAELERAMQEQENRDREALKAREQEEERLRLHAVPSAPPEADELGFVAAPADQSYHGVPTGDSPKLKRRPDLTPGLADSFNPRITPPPPIQGVIPTSPASVHAEFAPSPSGMNGVPNQSDVIGYGGGSGGVWAQASGGGGGGVEGPFPSAPCIHPPEPTPPSHVTVPPHQPHPLHPQPQPQPHHDVIPTAHPISPKAVEKPQTQHVPLNQQQVGPSWGRDEPEVDVDLARHNMDLGVETHGLKRVHIPGELVDEFVQMAKPNTIANKETCGLLMGKMTDKGWRVTHLFVPPQRGTADNCETLDEMQVFNAQIALEVVTLGWIHTHPSQSNFLSSIDLHTQYSHQLMLPEAVAIVVAPTDKKSVAVYTLPVPEAMQYLRHCRKTGFHEHQNAPTLFKDAQHTELKWNTGNPFDVLDLRSKR